MLSVTILVVSAALLLFYLQAACEKILRKPFEEPLPDPIVDANRLEFPFIRRALEEYDAPVDYPRFRVQLKCDYLALVYLLRNAANQHRRLSSNERALTLYFRSLSGFVAVWHLFGISERPLLLKMTAVLEYFANVLGERIKRVRFGHLTASEYLMSL
jgi:hypothetical protein